jgi:hypothetical protein
MAVIDLGIPEEDVIVLDGNSRSTQDEAVTIRVEQRRYLKKL